MEDCACDELEHEKAGGVIGAIVALTNSFSGSWSAFVLNEVTAPSLRCRWLHDGAFFAPLFSVGVVYEHRKKNILFRMRGEETPRRL